MTVADRAILWTIGAVAAGLAAQFAMAVMNAILWDWARPARGGFAGWAAGVTGFPAFWPAAPLRFLMYNQPIWGVVSAAAYGAVWHLSGRGPVRWRRVAALWAGMSVVILSLGSLARADVLTVAHASAALFWIYAVTGVALKDWVCR